MRIRQYLWLLSLKYLAPKGYFVGTAYKPIVDVKLFNRAIDVVAAAKDLCFELQQDTYEDLPLPDELNDLEAAIFKFETEG